MQYKTILAIDCATGPCSAAVWKDGRIAGYTEELRPIVQSARLLPMIEDALKQANCSYKELSAVACTTGPGSFTGIRIGLSAARGIAYAAGIAGLGFTTLEVMAYAIKDEKNSIFSVLNAGKGEWYCQPFSATPTWHASHEPMLVSPDTAMKNAPTDAAWIGNVDIPDIIKSFPRADILAQLAAKSSQSFPLTPFYIRPPDITMPKPKN